MSIHQAAAQGYEVAGADYERSRPSYPGPAMDSLVAALGIGPGRSVVDLGAGTGKLTRLLAALGADVVAVEPVPAMLEHLAAVPGTRALAGAAEALPLAAHSADAVTVGTAFHWFSTPEALAEIHRVLRPGGGLALLWNNPDRSTNWVAQVWGMIDEHRREIPGNRDLSWQRVFHEEETARLFSPLEHRRLSHHQELDVPELMARITSISFVASLAPDAREHLLDQVRNVLSTDPDTAGRERLVLPYLTDVYWCKKR